MIAHYQALRPRADELVCGPVVEGCRGTAEHLHGSIDELADGLTRAAGEHHGLHQRVEPFDLHAARFGLGGAPAGTRGELAGGDGGDQKSGQRHPVLRVLDGQLSHRREKEKVEAQHGHYGCHHGFGQTPLSGNPEDGEQQR